MSQLSDYSQFTGALPTELGLLTNLEYLLFCESIEPFFYLSADRIFLSLTPLLSRIVCLHFIKMSHLPGNNYFTGALPTELGLLTRLDYIDLG
jgi:hypothetical protein